MQWTPSHYDAYQRAFGSLLAKQLLEDAGAQCFRITDTGLRAIGISAPRPVVHPVVVEERPATPQVQDIGEKQSTAKQVGARGAFSRLVLGLLGQRT
jgi:hypothetical protein